MGNHGPSRGRDHDQSPGFFWISGAESGLIVEETHLMR
jgi:hypothetical protein